MLSKHPRDGMYERYPTQRSGNLEKILAAPAALYVTKSRPGNLSQSVPTQQWLQYPEELPEPPLNPVHA